MTNPTDAAIAQIKGQLYADIDTLRDVYMTGAQREAYERIIAAAANGYARAREMDAAKGGDSSEVADMDGFFQRIRATPPAQAAEAVERVAMAIALQYTGADHWPELHRVAKASYRKMARAAIAAIQENT